MILSLQLFRLMNSFSASFFGLYENYLRDWRVCQGPGEKLNDTDSIGPVAVLSYVCTAVDVRSYVWTGRTKDALG